MFKSVMFVRLKTRAFFLPSFRFPDRFHPSFLFVGIWFLFVCPAASFRLDCVAKENRQTSLGKASQENFEWMSGRVDRRVGINEKRHEQIVGFTHARF